MALSPTRDEVPHFFVSSFQDYAALPCYHAAICLYDSVNYLLNQEQVTAFFKAVCNALLPEGLFLFDICTELNSLSFFTERIEDGEGVDYSYQRQMIYHSDQQIQENIFYIRPSGREEELLVEQHRQRIYAVDVIRRLIAAAGFELLEELDDHSRRPSHPQSLRIHFLCRKQRTDG